MEIISYKYSIPYVAFLLFLVFLLFVEFHQKNRNKGINFVRYITIISFSLFWGFKYFVGRDVFVYYDMFNSLPTIGNWNLQQFTTVYAEAGFKAYTVILKSICPDFFFFSFVSVLIDAIILDIVIRRYSKYYVFSFILYLAFYGWTFELEQIRNAKSVMLFLLSLKYVSEKKILPYLVLNLIGFTFHSSAVLYIAVYPFLRKQFSVTFYFSVFIIGCVLFIFQIEYIKPIFRFVGSMFGGEIDTKVKLYLSSKIYGQDMFGLSVGFFERTLSYFLFCFLFYNKILSRDRNNLIFINVFVLFFISNFYLAELKIAVVRISALFTFSYMILYPNFLFEISKNIYRHLSFLIILSFACLRIALYTKSMEYEYENVLFKKSSIEERKKILEKSNEYNLKLGN